jgi:hypothetical protein
MTEYAIASMCNYGKSMADSDRNAKEKGKKRSTFYTFFTLGLAPNDF